MTMELVNIVGVQFRRAGRIYDFGAGTLDLRVGDDVVVETERGPSLAKVASVRFEGDVPTGELKPVLRVASGRDLEDARKLTPEVAIQTTRDRAEKLGLKMSVLQAEVQFGGNKVIVYFSASGRVDFRDLVKELAQALRSRVELKQVGARDEAKLVGGLGICGREFCCSSFLREFVPVSIKMAKNQNLALNPNKVSGGCGRLLCCLTYENDVYTELRRNLLPKGTRVRAIEEGVQGTVLKGDVLNQVMLIESSEGKLLTVPLKHLEVTESSTAREDEGSEAESWGEGIDLAALQDLEDESIGKPRTPEAPGSAAKPSGSRGAPGPDPGHGKRRDAPPGKSRGGAGLRHGQRPGQRQDRPSNSEPSRESRDGRDAKGGKKPGGRPR